MSGPVGDFERFLLWERSSRDTIEVKRAYIDMAGDLVAGIMLSQIVYWHLPSRDGRTRLRVKRDGHLWLAKGRADWWAECRVSPKQADRALALLAEQGLVEVRLFRFAGAPTKHVRIVPEAFLRGWADHLGTGPGDFDQAAKSISPIREVPSSPAGEVDFAPRGRTYNTETTAEITAAAEPGADAALVGELVGHGVGRAVARRLAGQKPAVCRRCLDYLPFADYRTTPGAWLAHAIRDEYGPPKAYLEAKAAEREQARIAAALSELSRREVAQRTQREETRERVREVYKRMEAEQGEALVLFLAFLDRERAAALKVAASLSQVRRGEYLEALNTSERRLDLFERWLRTAEGSPVRMLHYCAEASQ
jgi:hypothetical protein